MGREIGAMKLAEKVVLITGASSGIGAALAREFARRGAAVALAARRRERLEDLREEIHAAGGKALSLPCDVTRDGDLERAVAATVATFGRLDFAVANAGFGVAAPLARLTLADYRRQFETNVFGALRTAQASLAELARSRGTLVFIGSVTGFLAPPNSSAYAMSKFAVRALAESLSGELASLGIAVVHVAPGFVVSEIRRVDNQGRLHEDAPDPIPAWLRMPTERAARKIVRAVARRRREVVITRHAKLAVFLSRHLPGLVAWLLRHSSGYRSEPGHKEP
jgi:NAD(P)-dependent dehydrogenase (short-subunit alcohol dehydrogenase family)